MNIYGRSNEKKKDIDIRFLIWALLIGVSSAIGLILLGNGFIFIIKLIIRFWILCLASIFGLIVLRRFFKRKKEQPPQEVTYNNYYPE